MSYLVYKTYSNNIQPYTEITYIKLKRNNILYIATILNNIWKGIYKELIFYLPIKPPALCFFFFPNTATPRFALCLLLLPQNSNTPNTATPRRRFVIFFFFPNTATPRRCTDVALCLLPQTTKTQPLTLRLLDHNLLPSTKHRTKDEDSRLQQWWI